MGGVPVRFIRGAVFFVIAHKNERRYTNFFQTVEMIMLLTRQNEIELVFQRSDA